jgi:hypothetical protein
MTKCEFCPKSFTARAQTKKARACDDRECQNKRQRLNEKEWRINNKGLYGAEYYASYRRDRMRMILELVERFLKALRVGSTALHEHFSIDDFKEVLVPFFSRLGIRKVNKLCPS